MADYLKPAIAAFNGAVVGLGAELSLACDVRLAVPDAYFYYPEARRGAGLVTELCAADGPVGAAVALASRIAASAPMAVTEST